MLPLEPLAGISTLPSLLEQAPAVEVRAALDRAPSPLGLDALAAALSFARGALALREGALEEARLELERAASAFAALGDAEASTLARCEALLAGLRRGPRTAYLEIAAELEAIAVAVDGVASMERVWVVATHYRGLAEGKLGHAAAARRALHAALGRSASMSAERARILGALGVLYGELGAFGAAESLLDQAAEIHHERGDVLGEAGTCGELAVAALGVGDLERARQHLERQERLCARTGDAPGRARALAMLADVLLELGRLEDAAAVGATARTVAEAASPSNRASVAQASRVLARARREVDAAAAAADLDAAAALFAELGNPLGAALATWDRVYAGALDAGGGEGDAWFTPAWALASLGTGPRVAQLLRDRRQVQRAAGQAGDKGGLAEPTLRSEELVGRAGAMLAGHRASQRPEAADPRDEEARERTLAAVAQPVPRLAAQQEVALVLDRSDELSAIAARRVAAQRNLGRLAALTLARPGLLVAAVASSRAGASGLSLPPQRAAAACIAALPDLAVWVWPASTPLPEVGRDLAALRVALGVDARAALAPAPEGRVLSPPFAGEACAELVGVALAELLSCALALPPAALQIDPTIAWSGEAEARVVMAGYETRR